MSFDWMEVAQRSPTQGPQSQVVRAIREKAALLRRLGYDLAYTTARCVSDLEWHCDGDQKPPMRSSDVKKLVKSIYQG